MNRKSIVVTLLLATLVTPAAAEPFSTLLLRCLVQEAHKPGYSKDAAWAACEKTTQPERGSGKAAEAGGPNPLLFRPALAFHHCVDRQTRELLAAARRTQFKQADEAEAWVWRRVLDKCAPIIADDDNQAKLRANFEGSAQRMIDFRDGLLWSARANVLAAVADWFGAGR